MKYDELFHLHFNLLQATYQIQQIVITIYLQNIVRGRSKLKTFYILLFGEIKRPLIHIGLVEINTQRLMQKKGYTFATVYSSKCVSVFLHQTL